MKHLYLAESRLGLNLGGRYMREAAGPLDTGIYELEKQAEAVGFGQPFPENWKAENRLPLLAT